MKMKNRLGALAALLLLAGGVQAQTLTFGTPSPASTPEGTSENFTVAVTYAAGSGVVGYQADFTIPTEYTSVTVTASMDAGAGTCAVGNPEAGRIRISDVDAGLVTLQSGTVCTLNVTIADTAAVGNYNFTLCNAGTGACADPAAGDAGGNSQTLTIDTGAGFDVEAFAEPVIGNPTFTGGMAAGSAGQVVVIGTTDFAITTPAEGAGEGTVSCADDAGGPAFTFGAGVTVNSASMSPVSIDTSCPLGTFGGGATAGTATCTIDDANGTRMESVNIDCPAATIDLVGPTLNPPAQTTLTVPNNLQGAQSNATIQYSAVGGDADQTTDLTCGAPTGNVVFVSGAPQSVETGSNPGPIVVGVVLTDTAQMPAGTITCSANGVDTLFTINAPAGLLFIPPENIPASSLWSQLALIGLLAALGGVIVAVRRNA